LALPLVGPPEGAAAATITNILSAPGFGSYQGYPGWQMQVMTINAGDTVVWVNQQTSPSTNFVESYGGEWSSPALKPGVFADESLPASAGQSRFYQINYEIIK